MDPFAFEEEVSHTTIEKALGKKVEVLAFGISYVGILKKIDSKVGTIRLEDRDDYVVLEIERIRSFRVVH